MNYLSELNIEKFKGIENLKLQDLSNINIVVGNNNCGKTSLLEAISLLQNQQSIDKMLKHVYRRDSSYPSKFELFLEIFPKYQGSYKSIKINSNINNVKRELTIDGKLYCNSNKKDKTFSGRLIINTDNNEISKDIIIKSESIPNEINNKIDIIKIIYITPYDHFKDGLINKTLENIKDTEKIQIIDLLKKFDHNIIDFKVEHTNNISNPTNTYIMHNQYGLMPLFSFGDSIKKVLTLASATINAKDGILLVDEIETAIHKSMTKEVFRWFINLCKEYKVQLICTTHSLEAIDSIIISSLDNIDLLSCFRIEDDRGKIYGTRFCGNRLKDIRTLLGQDVR